MRTGPWASLAVAALLGGPGARAAAVPGYEALLSALADRRHDSRTLARLGSLDDRIARHRLDHAGSLRISPSLGMGLDGRPDPGVALEYAQPRWKARGEVSGIDAGAAWGGFFLPIIRSAEEKGRRLDSLIRLTDQLSRLEYRRLLLMDFQDVALQRIRLLEMEAQARTLERGTRHLDSLLRTLHGLVRGGKLPASALEPLATSRFRFEIRGRALLQECALLVHRMAGTYDLPDSVFPGLDVAMLAGEIESLAKAGPRGSHIFQEIDSLSLKAKLARARIETLDELDLWVGLSLGRMDPDGKPASRISLDLTYSFDDSPFSHPASPPARRRRAPPHRPSIPDEASLRDSIGRFRSSLEESEARVIQEIGLGSWESVSAFNESVSEYYEQGLRLSQLECDRLRAVLFLVRSFDDLPSAGPLE